VNDLPDILAEILAHKRVELERSMRDVPLAELRGRAADAPPARDMAAALTRRAGGPVRLIGEVKRRSPSAGVIREDFDAGRLAAGLADAGADAVSVLTDEKYFGGRIEFLAKARAATGVPVLRKDFITDPYQVWEARAWGADAFLLIADALEPALAADLVALGRQMGMEALVESHTAEALERAVDSGARLLGVNNRDLRTFEVSLATTERLATCVPPDRILVAESGVRTAADVSRLLRAGAQAVLVGEALMRAENVAEKISTLKSAR
jgi:indole-3-glycerol phosphate synthase